MMINVSLWYDFRSNVFYVSLIPGQLVVSNIASSVWLQPKLICLYRNRMWGPSRCFHSFSEHCLFITYRVRIWRVSQQLIAVKYECDLNNLTITFARSKISLTEKSTNEALVTPTPCDSRMRQWTRLRRYLNQWWLIFKHTNLLKATVL